MTWMTTYTGKRFDPERPAVCIEDIAHALALTCRYGGHCRYPFSVGQHSVLLARYALDHPGTMNPKAALLHDAAEAYLGDLPAPLKHGTELGKLYREMESALLREICIALDVPTLQLHKVKPYDRRICTDEMLALWPERLHDIGWFEHDCAGLEAEGLGIRIEPWSWQVAEDRFMRLARKLELAPATTTR